MTTVLGRAYERMAVWLPPDLAGRVDLYRPRVGQAWGGPLNGQARRRDLVRAIARAGAFDVVVETGTYRGTSTEFFSAVFGTPVKTVEADRRFYSFSARRLAYDPAVEISYGDSRSFLRNLARQPAAGLVFFYLDAHWEADLPLREELEIIREGGQSAVVMIDDFKVPGDPGYSYDDYGPGGALVEDYLPEMPGWALQYPSAPSSEETGAKRGCCVLTSPTLRGVRVAGLTPPRDVGRGT